MTPSEMHAQLDRANGLLVEKLGRQPYMWLHLTLHDTGHWSVGGAYADSTMKQRIQGDLADTPEKAFASIFAVLDAMPDPDTAAKRQWQVGLAKVIDEGHGLNLPDDVMAPLREGSQAMTDNLLAGPAAQAASQRGPA